MSNNSIKRSPVGFCVFLLLILILICFFGNYAWVMFYRSKLNSENKFIRSSYGLVYKVEPGVTKSVMRNVIYAIAFIGKKKYIVRTELYKNYPVFTGYFYKIKYLCNNNFFATLEWTPNPIDTAIVYQYYRGNNISFNDSAFNKNTFIANEVGGTIFVNIYEYLFGEKEKRHCTCCD